MHVVAWRADGAYRRAADAFRAGDLDAVATTIHEDVIWHHPGTTWMARDFECRGTLLAYLREIMRRTSGTFSLQDVCVQALMTVCWLFSASAQRLTARSGSSTPLRSCISATGRQKERWFHIHALSAFDEFIARS